MPAYNSELYIAEAIQSVLNQTYVNFEFIIINDGSTDNTANIIKSFNDSRIKYIENEKNLGLIKTLNKAIDFCKGEYIARFDADDVCFSERLFIQLNYLLENKNYTLVASPVEIVLSDGSSHGYWNLDILMNTPAKIANTMPYENCISHPSIMIKAEILKKYKYNSSQKGSEDWDLWLRLLRDKFIIAKTPQQLLKYRIHQNSVTIVHNKKQSPQIKSALVKIKFFMHSVLTLKVNALVLKSLYSIAIDLGYWAKLNLKNKFLPNLKRLFTINYFTAAKQYKALFQALKTTNFDLISFFAWSKIGGAEKVHSHICNVLQNKKQLVILTSINSQQSFNNFFNPNVNVNHFAACLYHPFFSIKSHRLLLNYITANKPTLFGSNSQYYYSILNSVPHNIKCVDLTHDFIESTKNNTNLNAYLRLNARVFISNKALNSTTAFYLKNYISNNYNNRLKLIYNAISPQTINTKQFDGIMQITFVGRDSPEKQINFLIKIANELAHLKLPFVFNLVGDIKKRSEGNSNNITYYGEIRNSLQLNDIYNKSHFIIITSNSEGFPLSLAEGMSFGCIPISTPVGDIPFHIQNKQNGYLCTNFDERCINEIVLIFTEIYESNKSELSKISKNTLEYSRVNFSEENFKKAYSQLLQI